MVVIGEFPRCRLDFVDLRCSILTFKSFDFESQRNTRQKSQNQVALFYRADVEPIEALAASGIEVV